MLRGWPGTALARNTGGRILLEEVGTHPVTAEQHFVELLVQASQRLFPAISTFEHPLLSLKEGIQD